jgi:hypothetical protein
MRTRAVLAIVTCAPLALAACPQLESDFTVGSNALDATSGDETSKVPDGATDVGDAGSLDATSTDVVPDGSSSDAFVETSADSGADVFSSDAQEEAPPALCCVSPAGENNCPVSATVYSCNLVTSPGAECSTDGGTVTIQGGTLKGVSAGCWIWWGNDSGSWDQCENGSNICCQGTVDACP